MPPHIQSLHAHTRTHTAIQLSLNESQAPPPSLYPSFPTASTSSTPKPQAVKSEVSFWSISAVYSCPNFFLFLFSLSPILPSPPFLTSLPPFVIPPSSSSSPFSLSSSSLSPPLPSSLSLPPHKRRGRSEQSMTLLQRRTMSYHSELERSLSSWTTGEERGRREGGEYVTVCPHSLFTHLTPPAMRIGGGGGHTWERDCSLPPLYPRTSMWTRSHVREWGVGLGGVTTHIMKRVFTTLFGYTIWFIADLVSYLHDYHSQYCY